MHCDMAREQNAIDENHQVAHLAIVRHVGIGHEKIVRADYGLLGQFVRAMHRHMLAKDVVAANPEPGGLAGVFQILRRFADHAARIKAVVSANGCPPGQINMGADDAVRADLHAFINDSIGADLDRSVQFRPGMNNSGRMNHNAKNGATSPVAKSKVRIARKPLERAQNTVSAGFQPDTNLNTLCSLAPGKMVSVAVTSSAISAAECATGGNGENGGERTRTPKRYRDQQACPQLRVPASTSAQKRAIRPSLKIGLINRKKGAAKAVVG